MGNHSELNFSLLAQYFHNWSGQMVFKDIREEVKKMMAFLARLVVTVRHANRAPLNVILRGGKDAFTNNYKSYIHQFHPWPAGIKNSPFQFTQMI